jgi:microcystin degradation protein MlrC
MPRRKIVIASMMHETNTFSLTHAGIDPRRKR